MFQTFVCSAQPCISGILKKYKHRGGTPKAAGGTRPAGSKSETQTALPLMTRLGCCVLLEVRAEMGKEESWKEVGYSLTFEDGKWVGGTA